MVDVFRRWNFEIWASPARSGFAGAFLGFWAPKKSKRGQMVVKNIPNAFRDPEKEHGCPSNLPAFRDPEKEHHWHRSHELSCHRDAGNCLLHTSLSENRIPQQFAGSSSYFRLKWLWWWCPVFRHTQQWVFHMSHLVGSPGNWPIVGSWGFLWNG